jgi:hypothetical protein
MQGELWIWHSTPYLDKRRINNLRRLSKPAKRYPSPPLLK